MLTYATKLKEHMCHAIKIGLMWGIAWTVIGLGEPWSGNLKQKFEGTLLYLDQLDKNDVVIFGDAFDVFYTGTEETMIDVYLSWNVSDSQVVFMAEKGCWPYLDGRPNGKHVCEKVYPASPSPSRYLNSGCWIGRAGAAKLLLHELLALPGSNDQLLASELYLDPCDRVIVLDVYNKVGDSAVYSAGCMQ